MEYRIEKEVVAMAALKGCANIVKLLGYYTEDYIHFIVMDYYQYGSLFEFLHPEMERSASSHSLSLTSETKLQIAIGIANGLGAIHKLGLVHRDLKSLNVLINDNFSPIITDSDLTKFEGSRGLVATLTENTMTMINSMYWRAPETLQLQNRKFTKKSDIWALGVIIWEIYKKETPYYSEPEFSLVEVYIKDNELSKDLKGIDDPIGKIILDCLKSNPDERPPAERILTSLKSVRKDNQQILIDLDKTSIHQASERGEIDIIKRLVLRDSSSANIADCHGATPLYIAAWNGHIEIARWLVLVGKVDVDKATIVDGFTPLFAAAQNGHVEVVKCLVLEGKADVDKATIGYDATPLFVAAQNGHIELVKWLVLEGKADIEKSKNYENILICIASRNRNADIFKWLLSVKDKKC